MTLPDDIGEWIADGVMLCKLVNRLRPGTIPMIHTPTEGLVRAVLYTLRYETPDTPPSAFLPAPLECQADYEHCRIHQCLQAIQSP